MKTVNVNEEDNDWYTNELRQQRKLRDETYKKTAAPNIELDWSINKYYNEKLKDAMGDQKREFEKRL